MDAIKLLGSLMGNSSLASGLGGKLLGGLLGGGQQPQQSGGGGLAGILSGVLGGGGQQQQQASPMSGLLGGLLGGGGGGGLGGLLGSVMGGGGAEAQPAAQLPPEQHAAANDQAALLIRAMVQAAKADGRVDQAEQDNIISKLGDVSQDEADFLRQEFAAPVDVEGFARSVPKGLEQQVYALSLTSIELDTQNEAQYLGQLAQGLNIDPAICNQIHDQVGAPKIFS